MVIDQYQTLQRQNNNNNNNNSGAYATSSSILVVPNAPDYETQYSPSPPPIYEAIGELGETKQGSSYPTLPPYFSTKNNDNQKSPTNQVSEINRTTNSTSNNHLERLNNCGQVIMGNTKMVAPLTCQTDGLLKANISHGVRQVIISMDTKGKYGIRLRSINKGIFVQFVADGSPAAAAGIRFGDQILKINDVEMVGLTSDKAMDLMTKSKNPNQLQVTLRDRPFERTITLHKDSNGHFGFTHKENLITAIMKDSSASRNGLLINHRIIEIDGRNVMSFKTKEVKGLLDESHQTATLTIMPTELYDEMVKKMDWSLMKKQDHSVPEIY